MPLALVGFTLQSFPLENSTTLSSNVITILVNIFLPLENTVANLFQENSKMPLTLRQTLPYKCQLGRY
jgi:hypothetical protein